MRPLHALLLTALALALHSADSPVASRRDPAFRRLHDGRVVDYRGLYQLDDIEQRYAAEAAALARANRPAPDPTPARQRQAELWRAAAQRYHVRGSVDWISANGIYVSRVTGARWDGRKVTTAEHRVFIAGYPSTNLIDGAWIDTWVYPIGPHMYHDAFHANVTIAGFDYGEPFKDSTNTLDSFVRLLPKGETNITVIPQ